MNREIKFRAWHPLQKVMYFNHTVNISINGTVHYLDTDGEWKCDIKGNGEDVGMVLMQYTGLKDKNGVEIYEGDWVRFRRPIRTTQTHTGDNIPNGSYTEPMEPGIETIEGEVQFKDGMFVLYENDKTEDEIKYPLAWSIIDYSEQDIKDAIAVYKEGWDIWDNPEEGNLQYLLEQYKLKDLPALIEYVSGIEIIGNIYENSEILKTVQK